MPKRRRNDLGVMVLTPAGKRTWSRRGLLLSAFAAAGAPACRPSPKVQADYIVPENDIEIALVASSLGQAAPGKGLLSILPRARIYLVTRKGALTQNGELRDTAHITYLTETVKGREAMALFTSERRVSERFGATPFVFMPGVDALRLAKGLPVVINPGLSPSAFIKSRDVVTLLRKIERRDHLPRRLDI
jgi:hypothetical protein